MNYFGDYILEKEIGRGASATVHLASPRAGGKRVCLKVFHPAVLLEPNARKRIEREYEVLASLKHANLIPVAEVIFEGDRPALKMDYVVSENLEQFQSRLPYVLPEISVLIVIEILKAIDYAHSRGIVHRDLKPENILFTPDGAVYVTDFGLAKLTNGATNITQAQGIVGTVGFMSPEQSNGQPVGPRSDLFSVGTLLYFLVTGTQPFQRSSAVETLSAIQKDRPEFPEKRNPKISRELGQIIMKALEKDERRRFQTAADFAVALTDYLNDIGLNREAFALSDWAQDPTAITIEALRLSAECLAVRGEEAVAQGQWNEVLKRCSQLSLKAPHSPLISKWSALHTALKRSERRRRLGQRLALALLLLFILAGAAFFMIPAKAPVVASAPAGGEVQFKLPPGIRIFWDGVERPAGKTLTNQSLGAHELRLERAGFDPIVSTVEVTAEKPVVIKVD